MKLLTSTYKLPTKDKIKISIAFNENFKSIFDPVELNCNKKKHYLHARKKLQQKSFYS